MSVSWRSRVGGRREDGEESEVSLRNCDDREKKPKEEMFSRQR